MNNPKHDKRLILNHTELSEFQRREIARIDNEIKSYLEYLEKLHAKNLSHNTVNVFKLTKKQRARLEKQNPSITKFSKKKLADLEHQKTLILKQRQLLKKVEWTAVRFDDYMVRIVVNGLVSEPFSLQESRKSFEHLKSYIQRYQLMPLQVAIIGSTVVSITNLEELRKVIMVLSIQNEVNLYFEDSHSISVDTILTKLRGFTNKELSTLFKLQERGAYLKYLCDLQSMNYKIIPTTEMSLSNNRRPAAVEDTFLFTITNKKNIFIIWESTLINRATYVFRTSKFNYLMHVQNLFDFIASTQHKKRTRLRQSISNENNPLKSIGVLVHDDVTQWTSRLQDLMRY